MKSSIIFVIFAALTIIFIDDFQNSILTLVAIGFFNLIYAVEKIEKK
jgi:hypothetical protein